MPISFLILFKGLTNKTQEINRLNHFGENYGFKDTKYKDITMTVF